jgi:hypothetical protein
MDRELALLRVQMVRGLVAGLLLAVMAMALVFVLDWMSPVNRGSRIGAAIRAPHPQASPLACYASPR